MVQVCVPRVLAVSSGDRFGLLGQGNLQKGHWVAHRPNRKARDQGLCKKRDQSSSRDLGSGNCLSLLSETGSVRIMSSNSLFDPCLNPVQMQSSRIREEVYELSFSQGPSLARRLLMQVPLYCMPSGEAMPPTTELLSEEMGIDTGWPKKHMITTPGSFKIIQQKLKNRITS